MDDDHSSSSSGDSIAEVDEKSLISVGLMDGDHSSSSRSDSIAEGDEKSLISVLVDPLAALPFTLEGCKFRPSNTIGDIRAAIVREVSPDHELYQLNDPKTDVLKIRRYTGELEDDWTIASQFESRCPTTIAITLFPVAAMGTRLPPRNTRPPDLPDSDTADDPNFFPKRPRKRRLPFRAATSIPVFDGPLEFKSRIGNPLKIDALQYCGSLHTSASHVLLTPSARIWGILSAINDSTYLVVHVSWDRLSFLLLRVIKLFYPDMPFVAVADLTPHQLDLLTFLDTPQHHMRYLYGWEMLDEAEDFGVYYIERLNIKWLGLRPSDLERFPGDVFDDLALPWPRDFDNVVSKIEWNPHFSRNQAWVRELELFKAYQRCVMFQPRGPLKNLISKRLSEMDWV